MTSGATAGVGRLEIPGPVRAAWEHRIAGPALRILLLYVVAIEGVNQFVFGRIVLGPLDIGLQSTATPGTSSSTVR